MVYKVSYVVVGGQFPGGITSQYERPRVGDRVGFGKTSFEVIEVKEISPPRDDFQFLHATIRPLSHPADTSDSRAPT